MRRLLRAIFLSGNVLFFGLIATAGVGGLAWVWQTWPRSAREGKTRQLVLLGVLFACLVVACIGLVFKIIRPPKAPEAKTTPLVEASAYASSDAFALIASIYSGRWEFAVGVGIAMLSALAKRGFIRRLQRRQTPAPTDNR